MSEHPTRSADVELNELKLRALAELAAGAGHEINNPVATIVGYAQQLLAGETDPDRRHALATIGAQAYRIRDMIADLMLFARPPEPQPERCEATGAIREIVEKLADLVKDTQAKLEFDLPEQATVWADPVQFRVVISSLVRNSLEALDKGGLVEIAVRPFQEAGRSWTQIVISDNGPGLAAVEREHLFDPFFSGRQAGRGLGFGLPKAWRIVKVHGGRITVETPTTGGVRFTIDWPAEGYDSKIPDSSE